MRFWLALTGILLFAAGSAVGVAGARWIAPRQPAHELSQFLPFNDAYRENEDLLANLGLSDDQKKKLDELKDAYKKRIREVGEVIGAISKTLKKEINEILTLEQRERLEDLKEEREKKRIEDRVRWDLARLGKEKGIPEDQRVSIFPLLVEAELKKRAVRKTCATPEEERDARQKISEWRDKEIEKILPANHFDGYKDWKQREKRRWEGRGKDGRRDGPPGGPPPDPAVAPGGKDPAKLQPPLQ
jgi:Spy/CpxP family protein refolding chaperone